MTCGRTGDSMWLENNIKYFTSQMFVNHHDVNELIRSNLHIPWEDKTFQMI